MKNDMASVQPATSVFFQLFKAHCSNTDLGPINVNWFEDLTREALRLQPKLREEDDKRGSWQDDNLFKTPQQKPSQNSQLESTPNIFREQSLCSPLFFSPTKDHDKKVTEENFRNVKTQRSPGTSAPANEVFGTSNRYLPDSPVVMEHLFKAPYDDRRYLQRTPQQYRKFDISDSLLCTPQLMRNQSAKSISESLGVEVDPEMSWSSSLATPPSPTLIIDQAKEVSKAREFGKEDVVIVRSLFSNMNGVAQVSSAPPSDQKIESNSSKLDTITTENMAKSSDCLKAQQKRTVLNAVGDGDACQVVENAIEGMEDVLSIFFTNEKPQELRKVKIDRRIKRKNKPFNSMHEKNDSLIEKTEEQNTLLDSDKLNVNSNLVQQKTREISLSYEWTPLNLPDTTQEKTVTIEIGGCGDRNAIENSTSTDSEQHRNETKTKGCNETDYTNGDCIITILQHKEHKTKSEKLPHNFSGNNKHLVGLISDDHSSSLAADGDISCKSSSIADQIPKAILPTLRKTTKFLYNLKTDCQQSQTTENINRTVYSKPLYGLEIPDAKSRRSLDLKNTSLAHHLTEVKLVVNEDDDDFKNNSLDLQEIEETFMNVMQTGPTDSIETSGVKSILKRTAVPSDGGDSIELQVSETKSISRLQDGALQHSEDMLAHNSNKVIVLESVASHRDKKCNSQENPCISRNNCDSFCTTPHSEKAESKSIKTSCNLPVDINLEGFKGFETASNKKINISEESLRKGELMLQEDSAEIGVKTPLILMAKADDTMMHKELQTPLPKEIIVTESGIAKESIVCQVNEQETNKKHKTNNVNMKSEWDEMASSIKPLDSMQLDGELYKENKPCKLSSSDKGDIGIQMSKENPVKILNASSKISSRGLQGLSNGRESQLNDIFTESQKAEISELSSLLENAGSQFDFTQVKKLIIPGLDNVQNPKMSDSDSQKLNTSDVWKDVDFNDSFAAGEGNAESNGFSVTSGSENKSNIGSNACDTADNKSVLDSFVKNRESNVGGGTSVNITDEDLIKAIFCDLEEKAKEKTTKTTQDMNCSPNPEMSNVLHVTAEGMTATLLVNNSSNIIQTTAVSSPSQTKKNYFPDTRLSDKQELNCKSDENHVTKQAEMKNSEKCCLLESAHVQNCEDASNSNGNHTLALGLSTASVGFATAKGKLISINKASLDKVSPMFSDILDTSDPREDHCRTGTVHKPSNVLIERTSHNASTNFVGKERRRSTSDQPPVIFSKENDASKVISDGPVQKPKQITHVLRKEATRESCPPQQNNPISNMSLFSTASGKPVLLCEESLKRVHKIFSEVDGSHVEEQQNNEIVLTDSVVNSVRSHDLQNKNVQVQESTFNILQPGFSTANGKMIGNSKKFLQKAQKLFADIEEPNVLDVFQRTHSKSEVSDQEKDKDCDVTDSLVHRINSNITQIRKIEPLVKNSAGLSSEVLADISPLNEISHKEGSNKVGSHKREVPNLGIPSFISACGKSIQMSEDSLKKAQGIFHDIDDRLLSDKGKLGSSVNQHESRNPKFTVPSLGFSTASGKLVEVSHNSLQKVRQMIADADDAVLEAGCIFQSNKTTTKNVDSLEPNQSVFSTATEMKNRKPSANQSSNALLGKVLVKGVDKSTRLPQQETNKKMAFFSKASGGHFNVSSKALQKAREMFSDLSDVQVNDDSHKESVPTGPVMKENERLPGISSITSRNVDNIHSMKVNAPVVIPSSIAFNTASKKPVTVSLDSLQKAKQLFVDTEIIQKLYSEVDNVSTSKQDVPVDVQLRSKSSTEESPQEKSVVANASETKHFSNVPAKHSFGFSTGNGKQVSVSNDALQKVKGLFKECNTNLEGSLNEPQPKMPCFSTAGGKSVTVTEESLKRTRKLFSELDNVSSPHDVPEDIQPYLKSTSATKVCLQEQTMGASTSEIKHFSKVSAINSFGFSTGSGKEVSVSEDALKKVKGLFEECNTNSECNLNENQDCTRMNTHNPLLNKKPIKDSVHKLGYLQKNTAEGNGGKLNASARSSAFSISNVQLPRFVKHLTPLSTAGTTNLYFTSSHTPENDFEIEAAESAKAFMDDEDLTDAEIRTDVVFPCSDKLPNIRNGKRLRSDDGVPRGEPPIKRQLLPEFDRSLENEFKAALKPLTSSPYESLKDRKKYFQNVTLQPLSSDPARFSRGQKDTMESRNTLQRTLYPKLNVSRSTLPSSSTPVPADCSRSDSNNTSRTTTSSFVIHSKKNLHMSLGNQTVNSPRQDEDHNKDLICEGQLEIGRTEKDASEADLSDLVANICCARDMQEMRIRKKQRQKIKPQPGSLYQQKTSSIDRINLETAVEGRKPTVYTQAELYRFGVIKNQIGITSEKARTFEFHCMDYFTREHFLSEGGVHIADGGWLVPTDKVTAGREEFYRALCDTPGVDPKLISPEWVYNHYRWIVWKLSAMEVMFPMSFAGRCLTPDRVLLQLKYRYDVEIDKCQRSAVRKIMERDDTSAKTLVLCISKILTLGNGEANDTKQTSAVIEVTDGWYGIKALLDPALTSLLKNGRMFIGQKIMVHGAELVGSEDACTPLEAPESLMLKIAGNSTRPARWYVRLGYFHDPRPFCLHLSSLLADGGMVGCVDVLIQRIYPMQWMEKMGNGTYVFRNERAEEREAEKHSAKQQKSLEALYDKIQEECEKQQVCAVKKRPRRQSLSETQIRALQDGAELYEALQNEPDPSYLESCLSSDQLRALNHHRQLLNDTRQAQIQAEFRKAIESSEQEAGSTTRRDVTPVWKIRIVDYKDHDSTSAYMLNIWRPLPDVVSLLKEGGRFRIYQLAASQSRGKSDTGAVQLTATKKTQFQQLQPLQHVLEQIYTERQVTEFSQFLEPHFTAAYGEVDVVGVVIYTQLKPGAAPLVYLSDERCNIVALKFYTDLGQLALEDLTRPCTFIAAANLRWRSEYTYGVPVLYAGDLSFFAANPKEHHLMKAIQKLRQFIQYVTEFGKEMENKLMNILETQNPQEKGSLATCSVDPCSRGAAGNRCSTPLPKINNPQLKHMSTPDGQNLTLSTSIGTDPKTCKKMKGLDYLSRIPSPAPLNPVQTLLSPSLQRAFRPPRSLHKENRTCAKTPLNPSSCTPSKLDGDFIADEELAMINTQALISGMEGGRKVTTGQDTQASDVQKKTTPNIRCPESQKTQKSQEVSEAPHQRQLSRKRKKP
ncbi:breast cancer type 2 susceptibility protein isoform X2 [Hyla sarda]|uniref:breast cancer type 2 susceptibility protein isoform X2 n=1 Tax=Hyla sarda TaxID=327740 RepID=UPI0024C3A8E4|nr:breast cancer type 2 susceptibility protein isoform X2 [Hyla sarda]